MHVRSWVAGAAVATMVVTLNATLNASWGESPKTVVAHAAKAARTHTHAPHRRAAWSAPHWRVVHGHLAHVQVRSAARTGASSSMRLRWNGRGRQIRMVAAGGLRVPSTQGRYYVAHVKVVAANRAARGRTVRLQVREYSHGRRVHVVSSRAIRLTRHYRELSVHTRARRTHHRMGLALIVAHPRHADRVDVRSALLRWHGRHWRGGNGPGNGNGNGGGGNGSGTPWTPPPGGNGAVSASTIGAFALNTDQETQLGDTSKYAYVITLAEAAWKYDLVNKIHQANPDTKALVYLDAAVTRDRTCSPDQTYSPYEHEPSFVVGVDYCWLKQNGHLNWILRTSSGALAHYADYSDYIVMDMSNPGYQHQFAADAAMVAQQYGWDGIYLDDVNTVPGHGLGQLYRADGTPVSSTAYGNSTVDFMQSMPGLLAQNGGGNLVRSANVYVDAWDKTSSAQGIAIAKTLDLYMREHQAQWSDGGSCGPFHSMQPVDTSNFMDYSQQLAAAGAHVAGVEYGGPNKSSASDQQIMTFSRATWLLAWDGRPGSAFFFRPCGAQNPADSAWTTDLGEPTGPVQTLDSKSFTLPANPSWAQPTHVYRRNFAKGVVLLNEMPQSYTVQLDGTYRTQDGDVVSGSYTLPGNVPSASGSAVLLTRLG